MAMPYCLCDSIHPLVSDASGCLLQHSNEPKKFSNTGKLVRYLLPSFQQHLWARKQTVDWSSLAGDKTPVLVFPSDDGEVLQPSTDQYWIVLDSTWQQARKILRQSPELAALPKVSLQQVPVSQYRLRRNQTEQGLCTVEVVAELLSSAGEVDNGLALNQHLSRFMSAYEAQRQDNRISNA